MYASAMPGRYRSRMGTYAPANTRSDGGIVLAGMRGLGQDESEIQLPDEAAWWDVHGQLIAINEELKRIEAGIHDYPTMGPEIIAARNTYSNYAAEFSRIYALAFGNAPAGLDGLGVDPASAAIIAAAFTILLGAVVVFYAYVMNDLAPRAEAERTRSQTQQTATESAADLSVFLRQQAAMAEARGDVEGARNLINQAIEAEKRASETAKPPSETDWAAWIQKNWIFVAVAAGLVLAAPNISAGVFRK